MARGRPDIANTALRIFLQEIGAAYDVERGYAPYGGAKDVATIKDFFGGRCCACNAKKQGGDWRDFIIQRAGADAAERHARMRAFLDQYKYQPTHDIRDVAEELTKRSEASL
ncbi:MAG: hypothetical protein ABR571_11785 [Jatrophihabitans sp.]|uniref:hypothetical protein n=1 Tax=Jatrophihabitans sp. TaxID=1932789 RepID=UPI0039118ADF